MDMIVEVVRLSDFQVAETQHLRGLGIRGHLLGALDQKGEVLVNSSVPTTDESGTAGAYITWFRLTPPALKADLLCSYEPAADAKNLQPLEDACSPAARSEGYASAAEITALFPQKSPPPSPPPGITISAKDTFATANVTVENKPVTLLVLNGTEVDVYATQ
jgi:hypothetical protein